MTLERRHQGVMFKAQVCLQSEKEWNCGELRRNFGDTSIVGANLSKKRLTAINISMDNVTMRVRLV
jgi:hypothetical protein